MKRMDSAEVKKSIFDILVYFDNLCREHNLKYFLAFGTCLGAIRHKDFIPWDDDADVLMEREDYEKLFQIMQKESGNYKLLTYETGKKYFYPFYKLVDTRTYVKEKWLKNDKEMGVFLDIFPLDGVPEDEKEIDLHNKKLERMHHDLVARNLKAFAFLPYKKLAKKLDEECSKYSSDKSKYVACAIWLGRKKYFDKEYYKELVEVPFHGHNFFVPKEYDKYLTRNYGDYMTPPPESKRKVHGFKAYWRGGDEE